jgi:hypothetical protein
VIDGELWSAATAAACGIDVLRRELAPGCGFGRAAFARERPFRAGDEAAATAAIEVVVTVAAEVGAERLARVRATLGAAPNPLPALDRARAGDVLSDADFFDLTRFGDALRDLAAIVAGTSVKIPAFDCDLVAALAPGRVGGRSFHLADAFDPKLHVARNAAAAAQTTFDLARSRLEGRVAAALGLAHVRDGEFVVMRGGVSDVLPPEVRVVREAPTYRLCELALDGPAREALAERDAAAARVAEAEERVRAELSHVVARVAPALETACGALGELDLLAARATFAERHACVVPTLDAAGGIVLEDAHHPPLADRLAARGRTCAPISLELEGIGVVTGPNMGGKTAALRTLGFVAACAALGVPVPARAARLPLFDAIAWLGITLGGANTLDGDGDLLSAFGTEVTALRILLDEPPRPTLVLVDEFARTTSPREGRALLVALIAALRRRGALGLVTTHLTGIASAAAVPHFTAGRLRMPSDLGAGDALPLGAALDRIAAAMVYGLEPSRGASDAADALALAAALGLDAGVIAHARRILAEDG